ncbi:MAG: hypothetical protein K0Q63_2188, partial [Paenibacillus sp.]|nr:hypothetical protein [Paenibacillus sp.]
LKNEGLANDFPTYSPVSDGTDYEAVTKYEGEPSPLISQVYTTQREIALTFNGLMEPEPMKQLLDELDELGAKATFFVPGMRVAEDPEIARQIVERGHTLGNNTLKRESPEKLIYAELYKQVHLSKTIIESKTGSKISYLRAESKNDLPELGLAAAQSGEEAIIGYTINLLDRHVDKELNSKSYLYLNLTRGSIVSIDLERNARVMEMMPLLASATKDMGYELVTVDRLLEGRLEKKPLQEIEGYDDAKLNPDYEDAAYELVYSAEPGDKAISLTFDDWGSDYTVTKLLDVLKEHEVPATFFLRANGVERNPNLARALLEEGHEVANHTYTHPVVTELTPEQLQEEVVEAHRVITEAIQQRPAMLFRPPTGEIDERSARIVAATGYSTIALYDVTVFDWDKSVSAQEIIDGVMGQSKDGSVILLHMLDDIHTLEALPVFVEKLKAEGYTFKVMSELIGHSGSSQR